MAKSMASHVPALTRGSIHIKAYLRKLGAGIFEIDWGSEGIMDATHPLVVFLFKEESFYKKE